MHNNTRLTKKTFISKELDEELLSIIWKINFLVSLSNNYSI